MGYKISIRYSTGDSFGSEDRTEKLELTWNDLEVAKANLKRIQEHYLCYSIDRWGGKRSHEFATATPELKLMYDLRSQQDWYVCNTKNRNDYRYSIRLKADNGNDFQISPFWVGEFESLYSAEIVADGEGMRIEF